MNSFVFVRHGEHLPNDNGENLNQHGLTLAGLSETQQLGNFLIHHTNEEIEIARMPSDIRFITSASLILNPNITFDEIPFYSKKAILNGTLIIDNELNYVEPTEVINFRQRMLKAYFEKQNLRFLYDVSPEVKEKHLNLSSVLNMAEIIANKIASAKKTQNTALNSLIVSKEFFYPSFRLKVTEAYGGKIAVQDYIDWYSSEVERQETARLSLGIVQIKYLDDDCRIGIYDDYSELNLYISQLSGTEFGSRLLKLLSL